MEKPRILLGDDHALIIEGLRSLLRNDFDIVGVCADGRELVATAEQLKPDAVLLDVAMPLLNGMEAARQIKKTVPTAKLVFVTQKSDREYVRAGFEVGASGYVLKQSLVTEIVPAVRAALAGRFYVTPTLTTQLPNESLNLTNNPAGLFGTTLTARQREVLQLVAEGKANKEIAAILDISLKTVDFHKAKIMDVLGLRSTAELTRYAIEHGIVSN